MRRRGADLLDRRQRLAAAALLMGVDLPAEIGAWGRLMKQAAAVCPGLPMDEAPMAGRKAALLRARNLIDTMLAEIG